MMHLAVLSVDTAYGECLKLVGFQNNVGDLAHAGGDSGGC